MAQQLTPEAQAELVAYGQALLNAGQGPEPTSGNPYHFVSTLSIVTRGLQALQGRSALNRAEEVRGRQREARFPVAQTPNPIVTGALPANRAPQTRNISPSVTPENTTSLTGDMANYANAISAIESGGNYAAIGPNHTILGRALGRYQIMESNLSTWLREAGLPAMTPEQFLTNQSAQDRVFSHRFNHYIQQFGSPLEAATAWFAGPGAANNPRALDRRDSLGTSVRNYRASFQSHLARQPATPNPVVSASTEKMNLGGPRAVDGTNLPPAVNPLLRNSPQANRTPIPAGALEAQPRAEIQPVPQPRQIAQAPPTGNSELPTGQANQRPSFVPPQITPNPNIRLIEQQLQNVRGMTEEQANTVYQQYLGLIGPQQVEIQGAGVAVYSGRDGSFMYFVPRVGQLPIQVPGVSTQQPYTVGPRGIETIPINPGAGNQPPAGGNATPPSAVPNPNITPNLPPFPQTGNIGKLSTWGTQAQAQAEMARKSAETQADIVNSVRTAASNAPQIINSLDILENATRAAGRANWRGPFVADWAQRIAQWLSNYGYGPIGSLQALPHGELIQHFNTELARQATRSFTSRGTNFDLASFAANNPSLMQSYEGSLMLLGVIRQEQQHAVALGQLARGLRPSEYGNWNDVVTQHYREKPTIINVPAIGRNPARDIWTGQITSQEDYNRIPGGHWYLGSNGQLIQKRQ